MTFSHRFEIVFKLKRLGNGREGSKTFMPTLEPEHINALEPIAEKVHGTSTFAIQKLKIAIHMLLFLNFDKEKSRKKWSKLRLFAFFLNKNAESS